jgi:hypothetical protein
MGMFWGVVLDPNAPQKLDDACGSDGARLTLWTEIYQYEKHHNHLIRQMNQDLAVYAPGAIPLLLGYGHCEAANTMLDVAITISKKSRELGDAAQEGIAAYFGPFCQGMPFICCGRTSEFIAEHGELFSLQKIDDGAAELVRNFGAIVRSRAEAGNPSTAIVDECHFAYLGVAMRASPQ